MTEEQTTSQTTTPGEGGEPHLIAGKFKDAEAFDVGFAELAKHDKVGIPGLASVKFDSIEQKVEVYKSMESRLRQPNTPPPRATSLELGGQQQTQVPEPAKPITMAELVQGVGIKQDELNEAILGGSAIPEDVYDKFGQAKITMPDGTTRVMSKELVNHVFGSQRQSVQYQQLILQQAAAHVGGQDKLDALIHFKQSLPRGTRASIDAELGDVDSMASGLDRLGQLYAKAIGADGSVGIVSNTQGASASMANTPFKSRADMNAFAEKHGRDSEIYKSRLLATPIDAINRIA